MTSAPTGDRPLLEMAGICKVYENGTEALRLVDLVIEAGQVRGLAGANGAGKSTLIKILAGAISPSRGTITMLGSERRWKTPLQAQAAGVATLHQNIPLVPSLSVVENVFLPRPPRWRRSRRQIAEFERVLALFGGFTIDPHALLSDLSIGQRQMVGILQAVAVGADLIVLDEPTASLGEAERGEVFAAVASLRDQGKGVLYVSHFLEELHGLADRITVLRDGSVVAEGPTSGMSQQELVRSMIGTSVAARTPRPIAASDTTYRTGLSVTALRPHDWRESVSLTVHPGEILGIAGLLGSGRSTLLSALAGASPCRQRSLTLDGSTVGRGIPASLRAGITLVPEDRNRQGLHANWEIWRNVALPQLPRFSYRRVITDRAGQRALGRRAVTEFRIRAKDETAMITELSGGNAQKVLFAKSVLTDARVLLLDEPTAGVDVGAREDLLSIVAAWAESGRSVIVVSSDFEELLSSCHRILVLRNRQFIAELDAHEATEEDLLALASFGALQSEA